MTVIEKRICDLYNLPLQRISELSDVVKQKILIAYTQQGESSLLYDPIEDDPEIGLLVNTALEKAMEIADREVQEYIKEHGESFYTHTGRGTRKYSIQQGILKDEYGIEWAAPHEMNPNTDF